MCLHFGLARFRSNGIRISEVYCSLYHSFIIIILAWGREGGVIGPQFSPPVYEALLSVIIFQVFSDSGLVSIGEFQYLAIVFDAEFDTSLSGGVFYRYTVNETLLDEIASCINDVFDNDVEEFYPTVLFIATWNRMVASYGDNQKVITKTVDSLCIHNIYMWQSQVENEH